MSSDMRSWHTVWRQARVPDEPMRSDISLWHIFWRQAGVPDGPMSSESRFLEANTRPRRAKTRQDASKTRQGRAKTRPRHAQDAPKTRWPPCAPVAYRSWYYLLGLWGPYGKISASKLASVITFPQC